MTTKRWAQIAICQHEWSNYYDKGSCANWGCTWHETRCRKCGIYSRTCACGFEAGLSGEPRKREMKRELKQRIALLKRINHAIGLKHAAEHANGKLDALGRLVEPESPPYTPL